ncbi:hypothetical protein GRF29_1g2999292 [Pseudopithomyces chartarum]|uniref:Uncharacterized protein n=1 Tax=Pseudopithomyces chartarum TaxID=1892770 RepID=A0AAN6MA18_9PLEO|nr:hypothetical protein GRF29_1g2999292 [Pseudopithomyces chartarum]
MADLEAVRRVPIVTFDVPIATHASIFDYIPFFFEILILILFFPIWFILEVIRTFIKGVVATARFLFEGDAEFEAETQKRFTIGEEDQVKGGETVVAALEEEEVVSLGDILASSKEDQDVLVEYVLVQGPSIQHRSVQDHSAQDIIDKIASGGGSVEYPADQVPKVNSIGSSQALEGNTNGISYHGEPGEESALSTIGPFALFILMLSFFFG